MKKILKSASILGLTLFVSSISLAQEQNEKEKNQVYLGVGFGLDYGSMGAKVEYLPIEEVSLFGSIGYNFVNAGWNVGASYNIAVSERVTLKPTAMYGANGSLRVEGAPKYDKVSNGPSFGLGVDLKSRSNKGKWNFGLYVPIRSKEFMDHYDMVKDNPYIDMKNSLLPITLSAGYNFKIN